MKNITYKNITIFFLFIIFIMLNTGNAKAVLQANGNTSATYNLSDWMLNVRKMEELGGAMGLSETLNSNLTSSSESNNIDVHMEKNTEYGALVILSASSYGNPSKIASGETTTGNATGVIMKVNAPERVVAALSTMTVTNFKSAVDRYKNIYSSIEDTKKGDAGRETLGWHGAEKTWIRIYQEGTILRNWGGSVFGYTGGGPQYDYDGTWDILYPTRAVVVSGERFLKKRKENKYNNEKSNKLY